MTAILRSKVQGGAADQCVKTIEIEEADDGNVGSDAQDRESNQAAVCKYEQAAIESLVREFNGKNGRHPTYADFANAAVAIGIVKGRLVDATQDAAAAVAVVAEKKSEEEESSAGSRPSLPR